jgi:formate dehydrogenase subunit gamma
MTTPAARFNETDRRRSGTVERITVQDDELLRHGVYTRVVHWSAAIFFVLSLLSGFAIYTPWLFHWLAPIFGGGPMTRLLHPWFSLVFIIVFALQCLNWLEPMRWTPEDRRWIRQIGAYVTNREALEPEYVGFFNGGQKLYFWAIVASGLVFFASGLPMWFPQAFGPTTIAIAYVLHDLAALLMLVGFIAHIYEATAAQPGTFRAMTRGTIEKRWAWTHHPAWYREATGRDPRADYERARSGGPRT